MNIGSKSRSERIPTSRETTWRPSDGKSKKSQAWNPSAGEIAEAQEHHDPREQHDQAVAGQKPARKAVLDQEGGGDGQDA
jgi:hypothetical protein